MRLKISKDFIVIILSLAIVSFFFGKILFNPNSYLLQWEYDGTSVYYSTMYYATYGDNDVFTGMYYPYTEKLFFATSHYNFTRVFSFLNDLGVSSDNYIGFLNVFILLSIPLGIWLLYRILLYYNLDQKNALLFSLLIGFLSPQLGIMAGYFTLGCLFIFPLYWFIFLKYFSSKRYYLWGILYMVFVIQWLSLYHLLFGSIFFILFYLSNILLKKNNRETFSSIKFNLSSLIFFSTPIITIGLFMLNNFQNINDRIEIPSGADYFGLLINFFPYYIFDIPIIRDLFNVPASYKWLGVTYFGIVGTSILFILILSIILKRVSQNSIIKEVGKLSNDLLITLMVCIGVLVIGTNILFHTQIFELIPFLKPFQQLRGFPRILYFIYYPLMVIVTITIIKIYHKSIRSSHKISVVLYYVMILIWGSEAFITLYSTKRYIDVQNETHTGIDFTCTKGNYLEKVNKAKKNPEEYSCILSLPFSIQGSEKITLVNQESLYQSFKASYSLGLPMLGGLMNRTSISHVANTLQLFSDDLISKQILSDFTSSKPILLIHNKLETVPLKERKIISKAEKFYEDSTLALYSLPLDAFESIRANTILQNSLYSSSRKKEYTIESYDTVKNPHTFVGGGALYEEKGIVNLLDSVFTQEGHYEISFWLYLDKRKYGIPSITLRSDINGERIINPLSSYNIKNNWLRIDCDFHTQKKEKISLYVNGDYISIDNLLLKKVGDTIIQKTLSETIYNNYLVEESSKKSKK